MARWFGPPVLLAAVALPAMSAAQVPADIGQVWKTYDIAPFVQTAGAGSQRHVVDWVLQETGYASWHGAHPASLSATEEKLSCFHVPEMQHKVADVVARFVGQAAVPHRFSVRVLSLAGPGWRAEVRPALQPIPTVTPGVQAWILSREEAAGILARLRSRSDCQELPTGAVLAANGLPAILSGGRRLPYVQDVALQGGPWPGWHPQGGACDEGLAIDLHPLLSTDGSFVEAVFRCRIDQVERLATVPLPTSGADRGRLLFEVPQVVAVRVGERFRWPSNQTLVVGLGLVPWPVPAQNSPPALLPDAKRRDVLVVVEPRLRYGP